MKAVLVTWSDAVSCDDWQEIPEATELEPHVIQTLGWLISIDDLKVVLACSWDQERGGVAGTWSIPKTWMLNIDYLEGVSIDEA